MAFDTSNDYSEFDNIDSGESGTVEGLLDLEGEATAFRYRKQIFVTVLGSDPSNFSQAIRGNWKVRIRASAARDPQTGAYTGAIIFEQEEFWTANVIAFGFGGIDFISWSPGGPGGSGNQKTTICNGQPCAAFDNPNSATPQELAAYGETGAWRFVDGNLSGNPTPGQKYDYERGFVAPETFTPEGVATIGGFTFTCEWQSANYLCEDFPIPEGAIFETVFDRWQVGALDTEALYRFSYKAGAIGFEALRDPRAGTTWAFFPSDQGLVCAPSLKRETYPTQGEGTQTFVVTAQKSSRFKPFRIGSKVVCLAQTASAQGTQTIVLVESLSHGQEWQSPMQIIEGIQLLATCPSKDGGTFYLLGKALEGDAENGIAKDDLVRVIATKSLPQDTAQGSGQGSGETPQPQLRLKSKLAGTLPPPGSATGTLSLDGTAFTWVYRDQNKNIVLLRSTDECATWTEAGAT